MSSRGFWAILGGIGFIASVAFGQVSGCMGFLAVVGLSFLLPQED